MTAFIWDYISSENINMPTFIWNFCCHLILMCQFKY